VHCGNITGAGASIFDYFLSLMGGHIHALSSMQGFWGCPIISSERMGSFGALDFMAGD